MSGSNPVSWSSRYQYEYCSTQKTFTYTDAELLSSVTHAGVNDPSEMEWDGDSNRVSFTSSEGGTWYFVYDTTAGIPAVIEEETPSGSVYFRSPITARSPGYSSAGVRRSSGGSSVSTAE